MNYDAAVTASNEPIHQQLTTTTRIINASCVYNSRIRSDLIAPQLSNRFLLIFLRGVVVAVVVVNQHVTLDTKYPYHLRRSCPRCIRFL